MMWYIKYFWVKLNIWVLIPLVKIEKFYNIYKEERLRSYVKYMCAMDTVNKAAI